MRETAADLEALQALLTNSIERASPFLRTSPPVAEAARARHFARRPGASLTYFEGTDLAVVAHGRATIIDERDPAFAEFDAVQVQCGNESPRDWQGRAVYLWLQADSLFTYSSDSAR